MTQTVLLAGANSMLGNRIAYCVLRKPDVRNRLLAQRTSNNPTMLIPLIERGAEIVERDLAEAASGPRFAGRARRHGVAVYLAGARPAIQRILLVHGVARDGVRFKANVAEAVARRQLAGAVEPEIARAG